MYEALGIGYLVLAGLVFTAEWIIAAVAGLIWLERLALRGHQEESRDLSLGWVTRDDMTRAEMKAAGRR